MSVTRRALLAGLAAAPAAVPSPSPVSPTDPGCIFCRILSGQAEGTVFYRDARVAAFADLYPLQPGHCLLVPLAHYDTIYTLPDDVAAHLFPVAARLARVLKRVLAADGMTLLQNNDEAGDQSVFHFHLHLIPRKEERLVFQRVVAREKAVRSDLEALFAPVRAELQAGKTR